MSAVMRAPLVVTLALASLGRLARRTPPAPPAAPQRGRAVSVVPEDGALLVDSARGPVLLIVAWDATVSGPTGSLALGDIRVGDGIEWTAESGNSVVMVDLLRVIPEASR